MEQSSGNILHLNGTSLYAIKEGLGEPVVLMHGFGLDHRMWKKQVAALQNNFTVISYDFRGFGQSDLPDEQTPYSQEEDYLALLHHFELEHAHIIALSMGGRMALRCALTCPHAVSSLILLDSIADGCSWSDAWIKEWNNLVSAAKNNLNAARKLWTEHSLFAHANTNPFVAAELKTMVDDYSGWHWVNKDPAIVPQPPAINRLAQITVPTLVVIGEYDIPDFQNVANKLSREIPNAQKLVVPKAGHMVNMEAPGVVNDAILNFLSNMQ
ncbi:MAG TPA: alpha/beta hydrolase [Chitinophagaceae bacterium]|nr:alpha/beta hydrolase [Chitinophagaceae bacterium]